MYNVERIFELRKRPQGDFPSTCSLTADMVDNTAMLGVKQEDAPYLYELKLQSLKLSLFCRLRTLLLFLHYKNIIKQRKQMCLESQACKRYKQCRIIIVQCQIKSESNIFMEAHALVNYTQGYLIMKKAFMRRYRPQLKTRKLEVSQILPMILAEREFWRSKMMPVTWKPIYSTMQATTNAMSSLSSQSLNSEHVAHLLTEDIRTALSQCLHISHYILFFILRLSQFPAALNLCLKQVIKQARWTYSMLPLQSQGLIRSSLSSSSRHILQSREREPALIGLSVIFLYFTAGQLTYLQSRQLNYLFWFLWTSNR